MTHEPRLRPLQVRYNTKCGAPWGADRPRRASGRRCQALIGHARGTLE